MIKTTKILSEEYKQYSNPYSKIDGLCKQRLLFKVRRGLYETNPNVQGQCLAESILSPSYLSFDYALAHYGLIPEGVYTFTSASYEKRKTKMHNTSFGTYTYNDVPRNVYKYGIEVIQDGEYVYKMATPEKALCDKLYSLKPVRNISDMKKLLFEDLRIDEDELCKLNKEDILFLADKYRCTNVYLLAKLIRREMA